MGSKEIQEVSAFLRKLQDYHSLDPFSFFIRHLTLPIYYQKISKEFFKEDANYNVDIFKFSENYFIRINNNHYSNYFPLEEGVSFKITNIRNQKSIEKFHSLFLAKAKFKIESVDNEMHPFFIMDNFAKRKLSPNERLETLYFLRDYYKTEMSYDTPSLNEFLNISLQEVLNVNNSLINQTMTNRFSSIMFELKTLISEL